MKHVRTLLKEKIAQEEILLARIDVTTILDSYDLQQLRQTVKHLVILQGGMESSINVRSIEHLASIPTGEERLTPCYRPYMKAIKSFGRRIEPVSL